MRGRGPSTSLSGRLKSAPQRLMRLIFALPGAYPEFRVQAFHVCHVPIRGLLSVDAAVWVTVQDFSQPTRHQLCGWVCAFEADSHSDSGNQTKGELLWLTTLILNCW